MKYSQLKSMLRYRMNYFLFTFRPQISEQQLFEDFLTIFLPELEKLEEYSYSVEDDNKLTKHLHVLLGSNSKDYNACLGAPGKSGGILNKKIFKDFKSGLLTKQTNVHAGFDDRKVKDDPEDFLKVLGYVNKETDCIRRDYKGFTNEKILQGVDYYYTSARIDKSIKKSDHKILTTKNIHVILYDWCKEHDMNPTDPMVQLKMTKELYCFDHVPKLEDVKKTIEIQLYPDRFEESIDEKKSYKELDEKVQAVELLNKSLQGKISALMRYFGVIKCEPNFGTWRILQYIENIPTWLDVDSQKHKVNNNTY